MLGRGLRKLTPALVPWQGLGEQPGSVAAAPAEGFSDLSLLNFAGFYVPIQL